ncbi:MAG: hypothetical protein N2Z68_01710 [Patescibacteria group bacterium]|nr:hypothetical protein [Patescibacteria group bacterium]
MENLFGPFTKIFEVIKIVAISLDVFLLLIFLYALRGLRNFRPHFFDWEKKFQSLETAFNKNNPTLSFSEEWQKVLFLFRKEKPEAWRLALLAAHSLSERALAQLGLAKENFKQSLLSLEERGLENLKEVERAYKLYKQLLTLPYFSLSLEETKKALLAYHLFLKELGVLK